MSMSEMCVKGRGFYVYASDEQMSTFIMRHIATVKRLDMGNDIIAWIERKEQGSIKETFFEYVSGITQNEGLYGIIADIMYEETGIPFEYIVTDEDYDDVIVLQMMMPWQLQDRLKAMTVDYFDRLCKKYIDELGGQLNVEDIELALLV